jgi:hypothetical protein
VVEWLTLLLRIGGGGVPGSSLDSVSGYPDGGFSCLSRVPPGEFKDSTLLLGPRPLPSKSFPTHHSLIIISLDAI